MRSLNAASQEICINGFDATAQKAQRDLRAGTVMGHAERVTLLVDYADCVAVLRVTTELVLPDPPSRQLRREDLSESVRRAQHTGISA